MQTKRIIQSFFLVLGVTFAASYNKTVDVLGKPVIPCQDDAEIDRSNPWDPNNWGCSNDNKQKLRGGKADFSKEPHD